MGASRLPRLKAGVAPQHEDILSERYLLRSSRSGSPLRHSPDLAAKLVFDMNADDLIETLLGLKAQRRRTPGVEILRPAGDDLADHRIGLAADEAHGLF